MRKYWPKKRKKKSKWESSKDSNFEALRSKFSTEMVSQDSRMQLLTAGWWGCTKTSVKHLWFMRNHTLKYILCVKLKVKIWKGVSVRRSVMYHHDTPGNQTLVCLGLVGETESFYCCLQAKTMIKPFIHMPVCDFIGYYTFKRERTACLVFSTHIIW